MTYITLQHVHEKTPPPSSIMVQYSKYWANISETFTTEFSKYLYTVCKNLWKFNVKIICYYTFSITSETQVSVTTQTTCSHLSPMKQCGHSSIVITFFLDKEL